MTLPWILYTIGGSILCLAGFFAIAVIRYGEKHPKEGKENDNK